KLPNGITGLANKITDLGLDFGLWFEPEMISKVSELYEKHPDWLIQVPNRRLSHGRNQFVLDFSREDVVDYIFHMMAEILREAPISKFKWNGNRYLQEFGFIDLPVNGQREVVIRFILGFLN